MNKIGHMVEEMVTFSEFYVKPLINKQDSPTKHNRKYLLTMTKKYTKYVINHIFPS